MMGTAAAAVTGVGGTPEVRLTAIGHFRVRDAAGQRADLLDLAIDLATGDYPTVTALLVRTADGTTGLLPWSALQRIDWRRRHLILADLTAVRPASPDRLAHQVLLRRDVLDALVLDVANRQATRANDLWLREEDGQLRLVGADSGAWAILRRGGLRFPWHRETRGTRQPAGRHAPPCSTGETWSSCAAIPGPPWPGRTTTGASAGCARRRSLACWTLCPTCTRPSC